MTSRASSISPPEAPKESVVSRFAIGPITFISFLISLALVDSHNTSFRQHLHTPSHSTKSNSLLGRAKNTVHGWVYRPQPYAYLKSPSAPRREKGKKFVQGKADNEEPWHWRTKQNEMMKMEIEDAFEIRHKVVVVIALAVVGGAAGALWLVGWSFSGIVVYL